MKPSALIAPGLLMAAFGTSLFFHGANDIIFAPAIILALAACLFTTLPALSRAITFPRHACVLLTLAFWGYLSISLLWTSVPYASLVTWLNLTVLPLTLMGLLCVPDRNTLIRNAVLALITATTVASLYVLWQFFAQDVQRASGVLLNPNNMAALINLSLLPVLAYAFAGEKKHRVGSSILAIVLFAALIATGSRGGLIFFLTGFAVIVITLFPSLKENIKSTVLISGFMASAFALFFFLSHTALEQSLPILGDPVADYSSFERLGIWKGALAMLRDHFLTGTGLGTFYLYYPSYRLSTDAVSMGHWAHMDALQFGIETGVAATLLFYAAVVAWLLRGIQGLSRLSWNDPRRVLVAGCIAALLALTLHAHIEFQFYLMGNLIMAGVLMAALYALTSDDRSFHDITLEKRDRLIWMGTFAITSLLVLFTILSSMAGSYYLLRARQELAKGNIEDFAHDIALSRQYAPRSFADSDIQLAAFYIDLLAQPPIQMTAEDRRAAYDDSLSLLTHAQAANPALGDIDHKRAKLYLRGGSAYNSDYAALADTSWQEALRKNPLHYHAREEYTRFLLKQGKVEEAYNVIQDGLRRPMNASALTIFKTLSTQLEPLVAAKRQFQEQKKSP